MLCVNEAGLYKLVMRSTKPIAEKFQEWVCEEVLPSIRKKGEYVLEEYKKKIEAQQKIIEEKSKQLESTKKDLVQEQNSCISVKKSLLQSQTKFSQRYEFPCKPAIYILENPNQLVKEYKFGKSENMNTRLKQDRTMIPDIKVRLIMYTQHYSLFENVIRTHFAESLVQPSHEWIHEEILEDIIKACVDIDKLCNFQSETETNLWRYNLEDPPGHREPHVIPRLKTKLKRQGKSSTTSSSSQEVKVCTKLFETMAEVLPTYLIRAEYKKKNADAQPGQRWCNGYCANYKDISKFSMCSISPMTICQLCESMIDIAQIKINSGEMTAKQIRENPSLILIRDGEQLCRKCSKILPVEDFFSKNKDEEITSLRRTCRKCRNIQARTNSDKFDEIIEDEMKTLQELEDDERNIRLCTYTKRDLQKICQFFEIGRKYNDSKEDSFQKIKKYFEDKST